MPSTYSDLLARAQTVRDRNVQLSTQLEFLQKQEEEEIEKLRVMGISTTDLEQTLTALEEKIAWTNGEIEKLLQQLESPT